MLFSRHLICLYLPEIKQHHWISVPKLFAAKALDKDRPENTPFCEMRPLHQKCSSQLYLECLYMTIIPFYQHSPFLRVFLQGFLSCWKIVLLYLSYKALSSKELLSSHKENRPDSHYFCSINEPQYKHTAKK